MLPLPRNINSNELIQIIKEICWDTHDLLNSYNRKLSDESDFEESLNIQNLAKGVVTNADLRISNLIIDSINKIFPNYEWDFLSEESDLKNLNFPFQNKWVWIIDPLDGTKRFYSKNW